MQNNKKTMIIANYLYDGCSMDAHAGYLWIEGNRIAECGFGEPQPELLSHADQVLEYEKELVMPGITDTHTFFTGYAIYHIGADTSAVTDNEAGRRILKQYEHEKLPPNVLFGHGWNPNLWDGESAAKMLEKEWPDKSVIIFSADRSTCILNSSARKRYQFTPETCYPEAYHRIMREYLNDREFIEREFADYMHKMNARGVTSVKEMGFDDYYGFTDYLKKLEASDRMTLRIFFMSQPVGAPMDLNYAKRMRDTFTGDKVRFSGFNRMTDGTIADFRGDLKQPYEEKDFCCGISIDYEGIEQEVLAADREGFRYSLHAQGDAAVGKVLAIYDKCRKTDGRLVNRHAITDMEFTDPKDLKKMGELGVTAELYFQIMSLDTGEVIKDNIQKTIGKERGRYYWNRRKMADEGVNLSGATDLPLLFTSLPESIYYSCGGYLNGQVEPFQQENTITVWEMLQAWTIGGQRNLGMEDRLGTLEKGKLADITVFDRNLLKTERKEVREAKVVLTMVDGEVVYQQ